MSGMAEAMNNSHEKLIVLADGNIHPDDKKKSYQIIRFNAWKPIRRIQKAIYLKNICKKNKVKAIFTDSWKSAEYLGSIKEKILVLAHGTEIQKDTYKVNLRKIIRQKRILSSYNNAYKIIANSSYTKELILSSLNINENKVVIIHPGIDVYKEFITESVRTKILKLIEKSYPVIITLARLEKRKGHKFVLNAIDTLKKKFPDLLYIIAGEGPYKKEIYKHAKELGIVEKILFLGWISEPEKSVLLKNSQLFIMTPTIEGESVEGFGMSFIDAGFHGLATIGTDSGGINDAIINEKTGLICNENDQEDITEKIEYLLSNDSLRKQYGDNGYAYALSQFTWPKKIKEYLSII